MILLRTTLVGVVLGHLACAPHRADAPLLRVVAHDFSFEAPTTVPGGLVRIRLVNRGAHWHHALLVRLDSTSAGGYLAAAQAGDSLPPGGEDVGGPPLVAAGDSSEVLLELQPGRYLLTCWTSGGTGASHIKAGMLRELTVGVPVDGGATPPPADVVIRMTDYAFAVAPVLTSGTREIRVENAGRSYHELDLVRLTPGSTSSTYWAWKGNHQVGPAPGTPVGGTSDFGTGGRAWFTATLLPGRYLLICDMHMDSHRMMVEIDVR